MSCITSAPTPELRWCRAASLTAMISHAAEAG